MKKYLLILTLFFSSTIFSQETKDSINLLEKSIPNLKTNEEILDTYGKLLKHFLFADEEKTMYYIKELKKLNKNDACVKCEILAWDYEGRLLDFKNDIPSAIKAYEKEISLADKIGDSESYIITTYRKVELMMMMDEDLLDETEKILDDLVEKAEINQWEIDLSTAYSAYANLNLIKGNLYLAKDFYSQAEKFLNENEKFDVPHIRSMIYNNSAFIYSELQDYQKASDYNLKAIKSDEEANNKMVSVPALLFGAEIDYHLKKYEKALTQALDCFQYFEEMNDGYYLYLNALLLAEIYNSQKKYQEAEKYILIAEKIILDRDTGIEIAETLAVKSDILTNLGKFEEARATLQKVDSLLVDLHITKSNIDILNRKINYFKATNQTQKVYELYEERDSIESIVNFKANQRLVNELETKYQTAKKEQQIELLSAENQLGKQKRKNQLIVFASLIGLLVIVGLALAFAYRNKLKTAAKIRELNQMKSRFFANISHEFRTPLTLIKSPLQNLKAELSDENQQKQLSLIDRNSDRMLELVNQLLELSKIDSGKLKLILKEGEIASFLKSISEPFEYRAKENNLKFSSTVEIPEGKFIYDKDVIEKIVTNLLSNAIKYTPENKEVKFSSHIENETLKIKVSNSGTNLKAKDLPKLFERFHQTDEENEGFGIGLALIKELVDLYKGKIETEINDDVLTFSVSLPLTQIESENIVIQNTTENIESILASEAETNGENPVLLIVDDNAEIRNVVKNLFSEHYTILEAEDGVAALKLAQKEIPDCIISDVMMPKMDGFEFTKNIKENELTSFIPVLLLTAKTSDEARLEALQNEADAFLTKPFHNEILKETVNRLIAERKKLQERYSRELILKPVDIAINSVDEKFLEKLGEIMEKELSNPGFSTDDFASELGMSRMQLHRKLKSLLNVSTTEFIRNERLKAAAELMKKGNKNVSEIAYTVGFNDVSYFSKCFKDLYDVTPSEFISNV